jgi:multicomponent Na+:H+ antiporter subunit D
MFVLLGLLFASAGVMEHSGIKIPFFAFFAHDSGIRCREAPANMLVAMGLTAALCLLIGLFPTLLYGLLPYPVDYQPYTATHVITSLQLLLWAALAFCVLLRTGLYPQETPSVNLDSDWVYRRILPRAYGGIVSLLAEARARLVARLMRRLTRFVDGVYRHHGPQGIFARTWPTGSTVLWVALFLGAFLILYLL